jgi:hypothetical protein
MGLVRTVYGKSSLCSRQAISPRVVRPPMRRSARWKHETHTVKEAGFEFLIRLGWWEGLCTNNYPATLIWHASFREGDFSGGITVEL